MFSHVIAIDGGKAKIAWENKKLKSISIEFDEPVEVDPLLRPFDLRVHLAKYLQGMNMVHDKTEELLKSTDVIKDMDLSQVPKEIRHLFAQPPGPIKDTDSFKKFKRNMALQAKEQIQAIKENTERYGKKVRIKKIIRKTECGCDDVPCYLYRKEDGTTWWKCEKCGKEVRAKKQDITERTVIFMMEEVGKSK